MSSVTHLRKQGLYAKLMQGIVHEVTNSEMTFPTVTRVELTRDSSHLYVYMNFEANQERSLEALTRATGFVRSQLAAHSNQRIVPHIHFKLDTATEHGNRIEEILRNIKEEEANKK